MFGLLKSNRIRKTRKNLRDSKWVIYEYNRLLNETSRLKHFETFKCSDFFVGNELAKHNRKWLVKAKARNQRKIRFIKEILKEVDTKYYTDYIGTLSDQDKKRLTRNNKIDKILL